MKTLLASALILASTSTFAHDNSFSHDSCEIDLNGGIRINQSTIEFSKNKKPLYKIVNDETLIVNGEEVYLTSSQQSLVTEYSTSVRAVVPEVKDIALDAIELATDGVNMAFNELLGDGNNVGAELTEHLTIIRDEVDNRFAENQEFYFDENGFEGEEFFGEEFEQRIESAVEETVQNSIGSLMIAIGQEMLFSGGDMDSFEARMENFGQQIEHEMEARGEQLEKRADGLCQSVVAIDELEEQMKDEIDELAGYDFLTAEHSNNSI